MAEVKGKLKTASGDILKPATDASIVSVQSTGISSSNVQGALVELLSKCLEISVDNTTLVITAVQPTNNSNNN